MTFNLYVQQNQWIINAVLGGGALVILFVLAYRAMWLPRGEERKAEEPIRGIGGFFRWLIAFMPWAIIVIILVCIIYTVTHVHMAATKLPNW